MEGRIKFTALPNGIDNNILRLSVFVSPEVIGAAASRIAPVENIFRDWPTKAQSLVFTTFFQSGNQPKAVSKSSRVTRKLNQPLWDVLTGALPIAPLNREPASRSREHAFADPEIPIRSFPAGDIHAVLKTWYSEALVDSLPQAEPTAQGLFGSAQQPVLISGSPSFKKLSSNRSFGLLAARELSLAAEPAADRQMLASTQKAFDDAFAFHYIAPSPDPKTNPPQAPPDFHEFISCMGEYPFLMRQVGLVIDLEIPLTSDIPVNGAAQQDLLVWIGAELEGLNVLPSPMTRYSLNPGLGEFQSAPRRNNPELVHGMLAIDDERTYQLIQLDVDGGALKVKEFSNNLQRIKTKGALDAPINTVVPPSLRGSGICLLKKDRQEDVKAWMKKTQTMMSDSDSNKSVVLDAEDLVRGYRLDVHDGRRWYSLCARHIKFTIPGVQLPESDDEGWVSFTATSRKNAQGETEAVIHDSLLHWTGWALSTPRPGAAVDAPADSLNERLKSLVTVNAGSLPLLRYGRSYRLRVRAADLAGNGVAFKSDVDGPVTLTEAFPYRRFEPLGSPLILPREDLNPAAETKSTRPGETCDRLVIRSNYDQSAHDYAKSFGKTHRGYREESDRHVVPPKCSAETAMLHGRFDTDRGRPGKEWYKIIKNKDREYSQEGIYPEKDLDLVYLPDPLARAAAFYGLPGTSGIWLAPFLGEWPDLKPFRIVITEGNATPAWDERHRVLKVCVPKAQVAHVMLSSAFTMDNSLGNAAATAITSLAGSSERTQLEQMALWEWMKSARAAKLELATTEQFALNMALAGRLSMITPSRELVLVHAVQQPLARPIIGPGFVSLKPKIGDTFSEVRGEIILDSSSTGKIELIGESTNVDDELTRPEPREIAARWSVFEQTLRHPFQPPLETNSSAAVATGCEAREEKLNTLTLPKEVLATNCIGLRHQFGDTKHRDVTYYAVATTRFLEQFLTEAEIERGDGATGRFALESAAEGRTQICVESSARPDQPKVLYIIPTFGRSQILEQEDKKAKTKSAFRERKGGGLRVYLDRPWFSSGANELLGVVIWTGRIENASAPVCNKGASLTEIPSALTPYVSQWGMDPLWVSNPLREPLRRNHFANVAPISSGPCARFDEARKYTLGEFAKGGQAYCAEHFVSIVPFAPQFDVDRQVWYCDIIFQTPATYYPFVRLALTRFQPFSLTDYVDSNKTQIAQDCHCSSVVLADFVQLAPGRTAAVSYAAKKPKKVCISLHGVSYERSFAGDQSEVEVSLEERDEHLPSSWRPVPGKVKTLKRSTEASCRIQFPAPIGAFDTVWYEELDSTEVLKRGRHRLVFREYELFLSADNTKVRRLVYAEALEI